MPHTFEWQRARVLEGLGLGVFRRHCRTHCSCVLTRSPCSLEAVHLVVSDHGTHGGAHGCLGGADDDEYEIPDIPKVEEPKKNAGLDEEEELSDDEKSNVPGVSSKPCCLTLCRCVTQGTDCGAVVVGVEPRSPSPRPRRARKSTRATGVEVEDETLDDPLAEKMRRQRCPLITLRLAALCGCTQRFTARATLPVYGMENRVVAA
jgi:hypothetical protein